MEPIACAGIKVITVFLGHHGRAFDSHRGAVLLFETEHGSLQAIVDATAVTAIRTAAVSALATDLLARGDAGNLTILGSGTQARTHLKAILLVRPAFRGKGIGRGPARFRSRIEACSF